MSSSMNDTSVSNMRKADRGVEQTLFDGNLRPMDDTDKCIDRYHILSNVPHSLQFLTDGLQVPLDKNNKNDFIQPDWLDVDKFKLGQHFAMKHFFGICYADLVALILLFSFKSALEPLIFSGKSSTPYTAYRRYLSTTDRLRTWYSSDPWIAASEAAKNITMVRAMHRRIRDEMNMAAKYEKIFDQTRLKESFCVLIRTQEYGHCPFIHSGDSKISKIYGNQFDMAMTQFAFVGLVVTHPDKFGAATASDAELDAFVHVWASLGHLLGIQDQFNFCLGGLTVCRQRSLDLLNCWAKTNLMFTINSDWEHMSRCLVEGISYYLPLSFECVVMYACWVVRLDLPHSWNTRCLNRWQDRFLFIYLRFAMTKLANLPGLKRIANWIMHRSLDKAIKAGPDREARLQSRSRRFMDMCNMFNTRD